MIISPPFLPARAAGTADAAFVADAMQPSATMVPGTTVPEGSFPVSLKLAWHGGSHLHAPGAGAAVLPVRVISDGEIVFARKPTVQVPDPTHPLNYNPYGSAASWTDDGIVIVRHHTEIGEGPNAQAVVFYSVIAHLSELRGNSLKVARGTATAAEHKLFRKDEIGSAGRIYGAADHVHMEIVCDDDALRKLVGRVSGPLALTETGRSDAVFGELYFHIPSGARVFSEKPHGNIVAPTTAPAYTTVDELIVGLRHASGDGAPTQRGSNYLTTYRLDGSSIGAPLEDHNGEYDMFVRAEEICNSYPATGRPAPSAVYELLRFGRIVNVDHEALEPNDCPHWQRVNYDGGVGWLNLNAVDVHKFSDADFPHWRGWKLIDDDTNADSRSDSPLLCKIIEDASNADDKLSRAELERQMSLPDVQMALRRTICKFPSEWNRDTVDARWGWLQTDSEFQLVGDDWTNFRDHIVALTVPAAALPEALRLSHWHFHPETFICHFRKCQWLSAFEFKQLVPKFAMRRHGGVYLWEPVQTNLSAANSVAAMQRVSLNKMARKFGISSPMRLASFFGNAIQETQWLGLIAEGSGSTLWYAPWYGRGFLQLTNPENYTNYWLFRGRQIPAALKAALTLAYSTIAHVQPASARSNAGLADAHFPTLTPQMRGWRDEVRGIAAANSNDSTHAPADSAGYYWAKLRMATYADVDHVLERVAVATNQGTRVYYRSPSFWRASAAVNLPNAIGNQYSLALNGFDARCVAYAYSLAVLSETLFPSAGVALEFPENYVPRRD
jgi:hypothetical protein